VAGSSDRRLAGGFIVGPLAKQGNRGNPVSSPQCWFFLALRHGSRSNQPIDGSLAPDGSEGSVKMAPPCEALRGRVFLFHVFATVAFQSAVSSGDQLMDLQKQHVTG
jgi:hypothetical protein